MRDVDRLAVAEAGALAEILDSKVAGGGLAEQGVVEGNVEGDSEVAIGLGAGVNLPPVY